MKVGYTPAEAYQMFRPLRKEVFSYFNYDKPLSFGVRDPDKSNIFIPGTIAHCDFSDSPDTPWTPMKPIRKIASGIRVNAEYLAHLYEDELICVLLHELAHVTAGLDAGHGSEWQRQAAEIGSIPQGHFLVRNWEKVRIFAKGTRDWEWAIRQDGPTMDTYGKPW